MEGKITEGKITGVNPKITQRGDRYSLGFVINEKWYNIHNEDKSILEDLLKTIIKKGNIVSFDLEFGQVTNLKLEELAKKDDSHKHFSDDIVNFEELLSNAHNNGLTKIETQMIQLDTEKKYALFKATAYGPNGDYFEAHGDADMNNCQSSMIQPHYIRMAETRAIARALRWLTNNAKCSNVETSEAKND